MGAAGLLDEGGGWAFGQDVQHVVVMTCMTCSVDEPVYVVMVNQVVEARRCAVGAYDHVELHDGEVGAHF